MIHLFSKILFKLPLAVSLNFSSLFNLTTPTFFVMFLAQVMYALDKNSKLNINFNTFALSHEIHLFYLHSFQTAVQIFLQIFPDS